MCYLVVMKDHFTQLVAFAASPTKEAIHVAHIVSQWIGLLGYPFIYQCDNGMMCLVKLYYL